MRKHLSNYGYSLVEIMVSVVLLSLVTLIIGLVLSTSTNSYKSTLSKDEAYSIAREKLAQFQNRNVRVKDTGSEALSRGNATYRVRWEIIDNPSGPERAIIRVTPDNGRPVEITGFIDASIEQCPIPEATNAPPSAIALSSATVKINQSAATEIGLLSTIDPDIPRGDIFTYALATDAPLHDNHHFSIIANKLLTAHTLVVTTTLTARIRVTDCNGAFVYATLPITVISDQPNKAPTDLFLSSTQVAENSGLDHLVARMTTADENSGDQHTYALVGSAPGNGLFSIHADSLKANTSFNFEAQSTYSITLRTTDNGQGNLSYDKNFIISITNVNEKPLITPINDTVIAGAQLLIFTMNATDPENNTVTWSLLSKPSTASFNTASRQCSWTPTPTDTGLFLFVFSASDNLLTSLDSINVRVKGPKTFTLSRWGLHLYNHASSGDANSLCGRNGRGATAGGYAEETLLYASLSELSGKTVVSASVRFMCSMISSGSSGKTARLFDQNRKTYSTSDYNYYDAATAWNIADTLGSQRVTAINTWYLISTPRLKNSLQLFAQGSRTFEGFILAGTFEYYDYYWKISAAELVVTFF